MSGRFILLMGILTMAVVDELARLFHPEMETISLLFAGFFAILVALVSINDKLDRK